MNPRTLYAIMTLLAIISCDSKTEKNSNARNHSEILQSPIPAKAGLLPTSSNAIPLETGGYSALQAKPDVIDAIAMRKNEEVVEAALNKTTSIADMARANDMVKLAKTIRTADESKVQRHAATKENVVSILGNIEPKKLKFGRIHFDTERSLVFVRIEEPIRIDLEYYFDGVSSNPLRLQSIHP